MRLQRFADLLHQKFINSLLKLEIHKVFPRFRAFFWRKISRKSLLSISSVVPQILDFAVQIII